MAKSTKPAGIDYEGFIKGLQSLLDTMPSESQKQEINNAFTELINFLTDLQNIFLAMPTIEDSAHINQFLLKLEEFYAASQKAPLIAASIGAGHKSTKRNSSASPKKEVEIDVNAVLDSLTKLSADEIRSRLDDKTFSKPALQALALELGMKPASNATKKSLADKIASDILNQRMRDGLAGRSNRKSEVGA
ncbi:MAG: hypothetical protein MOB07_01380 [Acidobacteria bacterium]|nr:hypothetical protein [Acidobacteriota bacterium]